MEQKVLILAICLANNFDFDKCVSYIKERKRPSDKELKHAEEVSKEGNWVAITDNNYPQRFKRLPKPPLAFRYEGDYKRVDDNYLLLIDGVDILGVDNEERLITLNHEGMSVSVGSTLRLDLGNKAIANNCAIALANTLAIETSAPNKTFLGVAVNRNTRIYVVPTSQPSINNELIKSGCCLLDDKKDLDMNKLKEEQ